MTPQVPCIFVRKKHTIGNIFEIMNNSHSLPNSWFKCDNFFLFQWPINQKLYLICRLLVSFALIGWFFADIIYESETFYQDRTWTYAVYATNWSFLLLVITSVYQTACSLVYTVKSSDNLGTNVLISLLKVKRLKIHFELASLKQKLQF